MKTDLKAKFLQHFVTKREDEGFTLIELLVVIIIIGILSAIALPSFLNQANKAKQSEAKTYIGSINRGQQAYYVEKTAFATGWNELAVGIPTTTDNYTYTIGSNATAATATATPVGTALKGYGGVTWLTGQADALTSQAVLCTGAAGAAGSTNTDCS